MARITKDAATRPLPRTFTLTVTPRRMAAALVVVLLLFAGVLLVGCGVSEQDSQGDPGVITEKDHDSNGKRADDWDFTIRRADGSSYEKDVSSAAYDTCYVGSKFPKCVTD